MSVLCGMGGVEKSSSKRKKPELRAEKKLSGPYHSSHVVWPMATCFDDRDADVDYELYVSKYNTKKVILREEEHVLLAKEILVKADLDPADFLLVPRRRACRAPRAGIKDAWMIQRPHFAWTLTEYLPRLNARQKLFEDADPEETARALSARKTLAQSLARLVEAIRILATVEGSDGHSIGINDYDGLSNLAVLADGTVRLYDFDKAWLLTSRPELVSENVFLRETRLVFVYKMIAEVCMRCFPSVLTGRGLLSGGVQFGALENMLQKYVAAAGEYSDFEGDDF